MLEGQAWTFAASVLEAAVPQPKKSDELLSSQRDHFGFGCARGHKL